MSAKTKIRSAPAIVAAAVAIGALTVFAHPLHTSHVALARSVDEAAEHIQAQAILAERLVSEPLPMGQADGALDCPASIEPCEAAEGCSGRESCADTKGCARSGDGQGGACRADQGVDAAEDFEP